MFFDSVAKVHYEKIYLKFIKNDLKNIFIALFTFILFALNGQEKDSTLNKPSFRGLPFAYYTPDTRWGVGALGIFTFNFNNDSLGARKSNISFGASYTQLNQILLAAPFQVFVNNARYWIYGELGYYRYQYNLFGIGNRIPSDYIETYTATYPRVRLNMLRKLKPNVYAGIRYTMDNFAYNKVDPNGFLSQPDFPGNFGGLVSGFAGIVNYDTRNSIFYPDRGYLIETYFHVENKNTGSDFNYVRFSLDASNYRRINKRMIQAFNFSVMSNSNGTPFHQMATLGGNKRLRGYYDGKYRDLRHILLQTETRIIVYKRLGAAAFGGIGHVFREFDDFAFNTIRWNIGAGLRYFLDEKQRIALRADLGFGYRSSGYYFTVSEAF